MEIVYQDSEFTTGQILTYLTTAYGAQVNGKVFTHQMLRSWMRTKKFPDAYGGHIIEKIEMYEGMVVLTVQGLSRNDIIDNFGLLERVIKTLKVDRRTEPKRMRTKLYFEILGKRSQRKPKKQKEATLPDNYKKIGIKRKQIS